MHHLVLALLAACSPVGTETSRKTDGPGDTGQDSAEAGPDTAGDTATQVASGQVLITEVMADNGGVHLRADGTSPDWVELHNPGPDLVDLEGWTLADDSGDGADLGGGLLQAGAFLVLWADGEGSSGDSLPFRINADGESLVLRDASGGLVDSVTFGAQREDVSWGRPQLQDVQVLLSDGSLVRLGADVPGWDGVGFNDEAWSEVPLPIGHTNTTGPEVDLAPGGETAQSSDGYARTGAQAVDGDAATFSHTGDGDMEPWWELRLPEPAAITGVSIINRAGCCEERLYNIRLETRTGDSAVTWLSDVLHPVASGDAPTSPGPRLEAAPSAPVAATRLRVSKEAVGVPGTSEWLSLAEVQVWGHASAPYLAWIAHTLAPEDDKWAVRAPLPALPTTPTRAWLDVRVDDQASIVIGGTTVLAVDASAPPVDADTATRIDLDPTLLDPEGGLLTALLVDLDEEDSLLGMNLVAQWIETERGAQAWFPTPTPGAPNGEGVLGFAEAAAASVPRGLLDAPATVTLGSATPGATLHYTLDGRPPEPGTSAAVAAPDDDDFPELILEVEHTTLVRTLVTAPGHAASEVSTFSYLLIDDILGQGSAPAGLPTTWAGAGQTAVTGDYEMDPEVVEDQPVELREGLRDIPVISVVLDPDDLWHPDTGIYIHSTQRGRAWERTSSVEFIEPDGESHQTTCGVRVHGYGWRPHANTRKHSLRLEFRSEYGPSRLEWPLFPDAPVDRFDSIVLRAQGSRGWQDFRDPEQALYVRDAFARDTAFDMGKQDGHATYAHLFLNGLYWGLYMPVERPDADFAAERFGGDADDWDAINRRTVTNEAIDGTLDAYEELLRRSDADLSTPEGYAAIDEMLDLDDLIDYMLIHQYTTNRDGPEQFSHNNMRGVRRRLDGERFRFFVWDMEYSLWGAEDEWNVNVDVPGSISHVYARLRANPDFRERYAARARGHLTGDGALTPGAALDRFERRCSQIERAVIGESARWGDTDRAVPYTRDVEWAAERTRLRDRYFPQRTDALIGQLTAAGLY